MEFPQLLVIGRSSFNLVPSLNCAGNYSHINRQGEKGTKGLMIQKARDTGTGTGGILMEGRESKLQCVHCVSSFPLSPEHCL